MVIKRIISTILAVLMLLASFTFIASAEESAAGDPVYEFNTSKSEPALDNYLTGEYTKLDENGKEVKDFVDTKEERLELMDLRLQKGDYRLYVDAYSGEIAVEKISTGDVLFSNPYDVGANKNINDDAKKAEMLSQILIIYDNILSGANGKEYNSFAHSVKGAEVDSKKVAPSQINVKYIKDGIRVDYSIGRTDSRYLVPERINAYAFSKIIFDAQNGGASEFELMQLKYFYKGYSLVNIENDPNLFENLYAPTSEKVTEQWLTQYPMLQKTVGGEIVNVPIYVFTGKTNTERKTIEKMIRKYSPDFTYEELDKQHLELNYSPDEKPEPLFKIALEYTLDDKGLSVRLPANGIRFDESSFRLRDITILPYMGTGMSHNSSYIFFPDGSGTLFTSENFKSDTTVFGKLYGEDYGYSNIKVTSGMTHSEVLRYPVFGISETEKNAETGAKRDRGFVAFVEEGESLMTLGANYYKGYTSVKMQVNPRPFDTIRQENSSWTVVSERKYTGNFRIRYTMLSDKEIVAQKGGYEASYVGMAKAYRQYLIDNGVLTKLTEQDVKKDVPLYIETFGAIETTKRFLSIPYKTNVALTSFADIKTMYSELSEKGVANINFILTGYAKGGLTNATIPSKIKWDNSVKKGYDFDDLLADANGNFGVYPDFDFAFSDNNTMFDDFSLDKHAVKSINGRYASRVGYSATKQDTERYFDMAISPAVFNYFYEKLTDSYLKTSPQGISVSTLGSYLNSDFDEDDPYNREDTKEFTVDAFKYFDSMYNRVITSGGNAYTWKYVDVITDISTDSSRRSVSAATVPFLGIVLHGFIETASTPINMEGNIDYAMLRAIENGVGFKFMLSYDNTEQLKEYEDTSVYYSIRYDIWFSDLVERYDEINRALKDVQTSTIEKHEFIPGIRIPDSSEIYTDALAELDALIVAEKIAAEEERESLRLKIQQIKNTLLEYEKIFNGETFGMDEAQIAYNNAVTAYEALLAQQKINETARDTAKTSQEAAQKLADDAKAAYEAAKAAAEIEGATDEQKAAAEVAKTTYEAAQKSADDAKTAADAAQKTVDDAKAEIDKAALVLKTAAADYTSAIDKMYDYYSNAIKTYDEISKDFVLLEKNEAYTPEMLTKLKNILDDIKAQETVFAFGTALLEGMRSGVEEMYVKYPEIAPEKSEDGDTNEGVEGEKTPAPTATAYNKYEAAATSIVYEEYSNGKAFVLNFNNFSVKVNVNGVSYTVAPYGYIVIK